MACFFIGAIFACIAFCFLIASHYVKKENDFFNREKQFGTAVVVGYERKQKISSDSFLCDLKVEIPAISKKRNYLCLAGKIQPSDYPIGSIVDVLYAKKESGFRSIEVHLVEKPPKDASFTVSILNKVVVAIFVIVGILVIVGIFVVTGVI